LMILLKIVVRDHVDDFDDDNDGVPDVEDDDDDGDGILFKRFFSNNEFLYSYKNHEYIRCMMKHWIKENFIRVTKLLNVNLSQ